MKRKIAAGLLTSLIMVAPSFVDASNQYNKKETQPPVNGDAPLASPKIPAIYSQFGGYQVKDGYNIYAYAEFLYWEVQRTAPGVLFKNKGDAAHHRKEIFLDTGFNPAFRVGIGMMLKDFDHWVINANYMWFHHIFRQKSRASGTESLNPLNVTPSFFRSFSFAKTEIEFGYQEVNANIERPFYVAKNVILKPFFGLKWLEYSLNYHQKMSPTVPAPRFAYQLGRYKLWSIGPDSGMNGNWLWAKGFSMVGKVDVALMYGNITKNTQDIIQTTPPETKQKFAKTGHLFFPFAAGGFGFAWDTYLAKDRYHCDISATYDVQALFVPGTQSTGVIQSAGEFFHGLTLHGRFDF